MRYALMLVISLVALIGGGSTAPLALGATTASRPVASPLASYGDPNRLDLAAMALTQADLPPGFYIDEERYFLTAQGIATFHSSQAASPKEIAALGVVSMYDSIFWGDDGKSYLSLYIAEFVSPDAVDAGFAVFEDETRVRESQEVLSSQDFPGPDIGEAPSETTVAVVNYPAGDRSLVHAASVAFRIDSLLVGVLLETETGVGSDAPDAMPLSVALTPPADPGLDAGTVRLVNELAVTLVERIEAVQAGDEVSGVDQFTVPAAAD
jgi:hypothetical protein